MDATGSDFHAYMKSKSTAYGLPDDCIEKVKATESWVSARPARMTSEAMTVPLQYAAATTLPDGRTDRKLISYGVPAYPSVVKNYGLNPQDAFSAAYVFLQLHGYDEDKHGQKDRDNRMHSRFFRAKGAIQVSLCNDGSVRGVTNTMPFGSGQSPDKMCRTGSPAYTDPWPYMDSLFRDAVALTRFELVKRRAAITDTASPCMEANWDGTK